MAEVPGVARTVGDVSSRSPCLRRGAGAGRAAAGGQDVTGHGWSSARLTPYRLISGRAPASPGDVVVDAALATRLHLAPAGAAVIAGGNAVALRVSGIAGARLAAGPGHVRHRRPGAGLLGRPGRVDTVAAYPDRGVSAAGLARRIRPALPPARRWS